MPSFQWFHGFLTIPRARAQSPRGSIAWVSPYPGQPCLMQFSAHTGSWHALAVLGYTLLHAAC